MASRLGIIVKRFRVRDYKALLLICVILLGGCKPTTRQRTKVVVSSAKTPEQLVLGEMTVVALKDAGYNVVDRTGFGSSWMVRKALDAGNVDICWEYTGESWTVHLGHDYPIADPHELFQKLQDEEALQGITWLALAPCQHTLGLVIRREVAQEQQITRLTDLARYVNQVNPDIALCVPEGVLDQASGIRGVERVYGLSFDRDRIRVMSIEDGYEALLGGECDCATGFATDVTIVDEGLFFLEDDKGFFQASNLAVAVRTPVLEELPALEQTLTAISALLTQEAMAEMYRQVVIEGDRPEVVAKRFLTENGLIGRKQNVAE